MKIQSIIKGFITLLLLVSCAAPVLLTEKKEGSEKEPTPAEYPTRGILHFMYGEIYRSRGNYSFANMEYLRALEYDSSVTILNAIAESNMFLGKQRLAIDYFEKALMRDPENSRTRRNLINLYMQEQRYDKAISVLREEAKDLPKDTELLRKLAEAYRKSLRYDAALEVLDTMIELESDLPWPYLYAAEIHLESGRVAEAAPYLEYVVPLLPPDDEIFEFWVRALYENRDFIKIRQALESWIAGSPENLTPYFMYIHQLLREDKISAADSVLARIHKRRQEDYRIPYLEAVSAMKRGNVQQVYSLFGDVASFEAGNADIFLHFAIWFWENEEFVTAIAIAEAAIDRFSREARWLHMLALLHRELDEYNFAEAYLLEILHDDKSNRGVREDLAELYIQNGDYEKADSLYAGLLCDFPDDASILNNYAYALAQMGKRLDLAMSMVDQALKQKKNEAYMDTKAWILYQQKEYRKALRWMKKALSSGAANDELYYHHGRILLALRKSEAAAVEFQKALQYNPGNPEARTALEEMGRWISP